MTQGIDYSQLTGKLYTIAEMADNQGDGDAKHNGKLEGKERSIFETNAKFYLGKEGYDYTQDDINAVLGLSVETAPVATNPIVESKKDGKKERAEVKDTVKELVKQGISPEELIKALKDEKYGRLTNPKYANEIAEVEYVLNAVGTYNSKEDVEKLKNAISTAEALVNKTDATEEELDNGIKALNTAVETYKNTELNKPGENDKFNIIISGNSGYKHNDKTLTFKANNGSGGYAMGYTEDKGVFYNQAVTLTYAGNKDLYYLSINEDNGKIIYVGLGTNYDGNNLQIRAIDSKEKALKIYLTIMK